MQAKPDPDDITKLAEVLELNIEVSMS